MMNKLLLYIALHERDLAIWSLGICIFATHKAARTRKIFPVRVNIRRNISTEVKTINFFATRRCLNNQLKQKTV